MKVKKGCNKTCLVQAALEKGDRHLEKHIRVGEEKDQPNHGPEHER